MDILGNSIISHFGVCSTLLLCKGNNSCCLYLAFTVRFIYKHQLPMVLEDSTAENPLYLFVVIILQTLYEYTACLDNLGNGIISVLENSLWCIKCTFTMQWQQYLLPVSCFHFSVSLLHAWLFWEMTSLLCWKFTLVYKVHIHYVMTTILVACVLQSHQNTTLYYEYRITLQSPNTGLQYRKHIPPTIAIFS